MSCLRGFGASLGFFTRLGSCGVMRDEDMAGLARWLPCVGLVLGVLCLIPGAALAIAGHAVVGAWLVLAASAWLTRGLHLDGLADVADAAGPHVDAQRFWTIIKDSRSGPFAIGALVVVLGLQAAVLGDLLAEEDWFAVVLGFAAGRYCCLVLARMAQGMTRPGLGEKIAAGADTKAVSLNGFVLALLCLLTAQPWSALGGLLLVWACAWALLALVRRVGAVNGDFLGASIVLGESVFWVACLL